MMNIVLSKETIQEWIRRSREFCDENRESFGEPREELTDIEVLVEHAEGALAIMEDPEERAECGKTLVEEFSILVQVLAQLGADSEVDRLTRAFERIEL